jgi:iron complex transport system permease protein
MNEADSEVATAEEAQEGTERTPSNGVLLAVVGVAWLAAMLWSARVTITGRADVEMEVTSTAYALPGAVSASLVAGAALALAVLAFLTRGGRAPSVTVRFIIATGAGLGVGLLGALSIVTINTEGWLYAVVGGAVAAAATIGGALAGFRYPRVTAAVCWGAVTVFAVGFVLNYLQDSLLPIFGAGDTSTSQSTAAARFALAQSILSGLAGGLVAYRVLRRARRGGDADVRWPLYALAGAGPGLLLLVGEALTRTAGSRVLDLAGKVSELELTVQQMLSGSRLNHGLLVLFVGAFTAMIAVGRTLGPAAQPAESPGDEPAGNSGGEPAEDTAAEPAQRAAAEPVEEAAAPEPAPGEAGETWQAEPAGAPQTVATRREE